MVRDSNVMSRAIRGVQVASNKLKSGPGCAIRVATALLVLGGIAPAAWSVDALPGTMAAGDKSAAMDDPLRGHVVKSHFPDPNDPASLDDHQGPHESADANAKLEAIIHKSNMTAWDRYQEQGMKSLKERYYEDAQKHFLEAIRELKKTNIKDERLVKSRVGLGQSYLGDGKNADAIEAFQLVLESAKSVPADTKIEQVKAREGLAAAYSAASQYKKAEALTKEALELRKEIQGPNGQAVAQGLLNLGELYRKQSLFPEAEQVYQLALETLNKADGVADLTKAYFLDRTGEFFVEQAKMPEAHQCFAVSDSIKDKYSTFYVPVDARKRGQVYYRCVNGDPSSARVFARGTEIESLHVKDVMAVATLTAQAFARDWYLLKAEVTVQNQGKTAISALNEQPSFEIEQPKRKFLLPLDSDAIAGEIGYRGDLMYSRLLHSADFDYMLSSTVGTTGGVVATPFGAPAFFNSVSTWTTITPNWGARMQARNAAMSAFAGASRDAGTVSHNKPAPTTIGPGETARFLIFYPYTKFQAGTLRFLLGNTVFEFPFTSHSG